MKKIINFKDEMIDFAKEVASSISIKDVIGLKGTLGAGKSFFAKHFVNSLCEKPIEVLSPTFNLVYSYDTKKGEVFHFDLYRLKSAEELENIGFFDALQNGICLIEWPEIAEKFLKKNYLEIEIKTLTGENQQAREILLTRKSDGKIRI
ncbi:MAG: tRNA (adenosine(37)-N6)-threonylcarbamoyltransferase complex ATPase subunit type 1 TsaE [Proteobacteria bacterium]|nr:tRNA (adenosine(37)-N6)-threonylcarbamoyltransferase complex ATPase subunit type 1 TsaE [Pseudomonadota bacterium]